MAEPTWILGFDGDCLTCRQLAEEVARLANGRLAVRSLREPEVAAWRARALGPDAPWAPTLFRVEGERVEAWTGRRLAWQLARLLGPGRALAMAERLSNPTSSGPRLTRRTVLRALALGGGLLLVTSDGAASLAKPTTPRDTASASNLDALPGGMASHAAPVAGWVLARPATAPSPRAGAALAFDPANGGLLLFGGAGPGPSGPKTPGAAPSSSGGPLHDTWLWDGQAWHPLNPPESPPGRVSAGLVPDLARRQLLLFGGIAIDPAGGNGQLLNDTWLWDGQRWTAVSSTDAPPPEAKPNLAYDPIRGGIVLFSGVSGQTWVWDGRRWIQQQTAPSPGPGMWWGMGYDSAHQELVLFGGGGGRAPTSETWTWDGQTWIRHTPQSPPAGPGWILDARGRVLFVAGDLQQAWTWDGSSWTSLAMPLIAPSPRLEVALAADLQSGRLYAFGGQWGMTSFAELWTWELPSLA